MLEVDTQTDTVALGLVMEPTGARYQKLSKDTLSNPCFFGYKWENDKIVEVQAIFPDEVFNKEFAMFMEANKK